VAVIAGGAALLNFQETQKHNRLARQKDREQLDLTRRGQVTERFTKAIDQLGQVGDDKLAIRLGGIYALEQIAHDSEELHGPVMEVLTAYVRQPDASGRQEGQMSAEASEQGQTGSQRRGMPTDVQAVIAVLGRRKARADELRLDLSSTDLRWGRFAGGDKGNFRNTDFRGACLQGAELKETDLEGADFGFTHLEGAKFVDATGLTPKQLAEAHCDESTVLPSYLQWRCSNGLILTPNN
jgi:hypothetical protein